MMVNSLMECRQTPVFSKPVSIRRNWFRLGARAGSFPVLYWFSINSSASLISHLCSGQFRFSNDRGVVML